MIGKEQEELLFIVDPLHKSDAVQNEPANRFPLPKQLNTAIESLGDAAVSCILVRRADFEPQIVTYPNGNPSLLATLRPL